jgi:hypothetical protein
MRVPAQRPQMSVGEVLALIEPFQIPDKCPLVFVGLRGYFAKILGELGNERNVYDDAIGVVHRAAHAVYWVNGNTDPSRSKPGEGSGSAKGEFVLDPGVWYVYRFDLHHGLSGAYPAICQRAGPVMGCRDGKAEAYPAEVAGGINIHRGGTTWTGSEGCQTVFPTQWGGFYTGAKTRALELFGAEWQSVVLPYALIEYVRDPAQELTNPAPAGFTAGKENST